MTMEAPQIIVLALWGISLGVHLAKHGEPRIEVDGSQQKYSFTKDVIRVSIWSGLLYWGGFFG